MAEKWTKASLDGLSQQIKEEASGKRVEEELMLAFYQDFGVLPLRNAMQNLEQENQVRSGRALQGAFQNIPAIICGAGPSLERSFALLKQMGDKGLIFGAGSALGPLSKHHIPVHCLVACDPDPPMERFVGQSYFQAPLFYQNQVSTSLLRSHQGAKVCMGESGSFPLEKWWEEGFWNEPFDVGWSVGTFATSIAAFCGCSPIYLVGIDLCVSENKGYALGVEGIDESNNWAFASDCFGNRQATRPDFLMSKAWLEYFAKKRPENPLINVSQGLVLEGIAEGSLPCITHSIDLFGRVHQVIEKAPLLPLGCARFKTKQVEESVDRIQTLLKQWMECIQDERSRILCTCALEEELFYQFHLLPMWAIWKPLLQEEEGIGALECPMIEKQLQEMLFYQYVTKQWIDGRQILP